MFSLHRILSLSLAMRSIESGGSMQTMDARILVFFTANCRNEVVVYLGGTFIHAQQNSLILFQTLYWDG
jgi:hypothetical protein